MSTRFSQTRLVPDKSASSCPFAHGGGITGGGEGVAADKAPWFEDQNNSNKAATKQQQPSIQADAISQYSTTQNRPDVLRNQYLQKLKWKAGWQWVPLPQQQAVPPFAVVVAQRPATPLMTTFAHTRLAAESSAKSASACPAWHTAAESDVRSITSALGTTGQQACLAEQHCTAWCLSQLASSTVLDREDSLGFEVD